MASICYFNKAKVLKSWLLYIYLLINHPGYFLMMKIAMPKFLINLTIFYYLT